MMTEVEVKIYRLTLYSKMRNTHRERMEALNEGNYDLLPELNSKFQEFAGQINIVERILQD